MYKVFVKNSVYFNVVRYIIRVDVVLFFFRRCINFFRLKVSSVMMMKIIVLVKVWLMNVVMVC